jgi:type I restriction enzyme S subunit
VNECTQKNTDGYVTEYLSLMANIGIIRYEDKGDIGNKKPDDLSKCKIVEKGNLVINSMNYGIGSYGLSSLDGICSPVYIVLQPKGEVVNERYALRIFEEREFQSWAQSFGNGILAHRCAIGWDDLKNINVALPPTSEQIQIARFLDHETARIDALIAEQQRLIELLKEKRQAVISHAVTKGLDPTAPMKDSGVEWLGEVPAHWEVGKFKWFLRTASGGTPPSSDRNTYYDGNIPWLRSLDLNDDLVIDFEVSVTQKAIDETSCKMVPENSVLIAMYGGDGTIGKNGLLMFDSAINQALCAFLPSPDFEPKYLHRYIQFYRPHWMINAESSRKDPNIG